MNSRNEAQNFVQKPWAKAAFGFFFFQLFFSPAFANPTQDLNKVLSDISWHGVAEGRYPETVDRIKRLLSEGADPNYVPQGQASAITIAVSWCTNPESCQILEAFRGSTCLNIEGDIGLPFKVGTPLLFAAYSGRTLAVRKLLEIGADPHLASGKRLPIQWISGRENPRQILDDLISHGCSPNAQIDNGETPLLIAARLGNYEVMKALLERKADVNLGSKHGYTALHHACCGLFHEACVDLLLEAGADVFALDKENRNALDTLRSTSLYTKNRKKNAENIEHKLIERGLQPSQAKRADEQRPGAKENSEASAQQ